MTSTASASPVTAAAESPTMNRIIGGIDIRKILAIAWRRKYLMAGLTVLFVLVGMFYASRLTPEYTTSATILLKTRETRVVNLDDVVSGLGTNMAAVGTEIQLIRSTQLLERVVDKLRLDRDPEFNPVLQPPSMSVFQQVVHGVLPDGLADRLAPVRVRKVSQADLDDDVRRQKARILAINILRAKMSVDPVLGSYTIRVTFRSPDPDKARLIANTLAEQYIVDQLEAKYEATRRATGWLSTRLADLKDQVEAKEAAVEAFKAQQSNTGGQGVELTTQQLTQLNAELVQARTRRAEAEARYRQVSQQVQSQGSAAAANTLSSTSIDSLRQKEAELRRQEAELSTRYAEKHPRILNIRAEIADNRKAIEAEVQKLVRSLETELNVAVARERTLQQSVNQLERRSINQNQSSVQLRQLEREAEATRQIYTAFLSRFKETSEQEQIQQADSRIISPAERPGAPSYPRKMRIYLIAGLLGLGFSIGIVVLLEQLDNTFMSSEQLESAVGLVTLGVIPLVKGFRRSRSDVLDYVVSKPTSGLAEACRSLRVAINLSNVDKPPQVILTTSSLPSEGKSTTAILLAGASASMGKKVIVVDCDLRRPSVHHTLKINNDRSVIEVLTGRCELGEAVQKHEATGVYALAAKETSATAIDLLSSQAFKQLIVHLRETYDVVVLDSAPTLAVSDSLVLSQMADSLIYVVKWNDTPREVVMSGVARLKENGVHITGCALTQVNMERQARYGYYYSGSSYYYGRYKNYYKS